MEMITVGNREYKLIIEYKNNKNLYLKVNDDILKVTCNSHVSKDYIRKFIRKKEKWILNRAKIKKVGINNSTLYYLGKLYKVIYVKDYSNTFKITDDLITFYTVVFDEQYFLKLFYEYKSKELVSIVNKYYDFCYNNLVRYNIIRPMVEIKYYKSRWGSCNFVKGKISMNITLIHFNEEVIKSVLLHEFAHLVYHNHSGDYYSLLLSIMPNYRIIQKELK
jgi:hypothetical protein